MNQGKLCELQTNYLQNNGFQLILPRFPHVTFYAQDFSMPEIALGAPRVGTPFVDLPVAGDKVSFSPIQFSFIVDENLNNYKEIFNWIASIGYATGFDKYTKYANKDSHQPLGEQDAKVMFLSSKNNPTQVVTFYDAIPISLSGFQFTTQDPTTNYIMASAVFDYSYFDFEAT